MDVFFTRLRPCSPLARLPAGLDPVRLLLTRAAGLGDVRAIGSGNIGATNVLRTGHKGLAALTLLLDALKGTAAVLIGHRSARWRPPSWPRCSPASPPSSATFFRSGSASRAARASRPTSACCSASSGRPRSSSAPSGCVAALTRYSSLSALSPRVVAPVVLFALGDRPDGAARRVLIGAADL